MRIVLDLQAVQSGADAAARLKAMARAKALLRAGTAHDVLILLNASCPDTAEEIRQAFDGLLPPARFRLFHPPPQAAGAWRSQATELMRDAFIADLEPDLVHRLFLHDGGTSDIAVLATRRVAAAAPARPKLAFISPLPPAKSGIADYSAELLPVLAQHYEIELVPTGDAACAPPLAALFPVRTPGWFAAHADEYDRVLYQIGNSHCHAEMVGLIEQHPGVSSGT